MTNLDLLNHSENVERIQHIFSPKLSRGLGMIALGTQKIVINPDNDLKIRVLLIFNRSSSSANWSV